MKNLKNKKLILNKKSEYIPDDYYDYYKKLRESLLTQAKSKGYPLQEALITDSKSLGYAIEAAIDDASYKGEKLSKADAVKIIIEREYKTISDKQAAAMIEWRDKNKKNKDKNLKNILKDMSEEEVAVYGGYIAKKGEEYDFVPQYYDLTITQQEKVKNIKNFFDEIKRVYHEKRAQHGSGKAATQTIMLEIAQEFFGSL